MGVKGRLRECAEVVVLAVFLSAAADFIMMMVLSGQPFDPGWSEVRNLAVMAAALPAPFLAAKWSGRSWRDLFGPAQRVRWGLLARCLLVAGGVYATVLAWRLASGGFINIALVATCFIVVPLQAAAEEAIFRGSLPQLIGGSAWLAYGLPGLVFVVGHTGGPFSLVGVAAFAACVSYLAWRSDGLEAPVALHTCTNLAFYVPLVCGSPVHIADFFINVAAPLCATGLIALLLRRYPRNGYASSPLPKKSSEPRTPGSA